MNIFFKSIISFISTRNGVIIISCTIILLFIVSIINNQDNDSTPLQAKSNIEKKIIEIFEQSSCEVNITEVINVECDNDTKISWSKINSNLINGTINIINPRFQFDDKELKFSELKVDIPFKQVTAIIKKSIKNESISLSAFNLSFLDMEFFDNSIGNSTIEKIEMGDFSLQFNGDIPLENFQNLYDAAIMSNENNMLNFNGNNLEIHVSDDLKSQIDFPLPEKNFSIENFEIEISLNNHAFSISSRNFDTNLFDADLDVNISIDNKDFDDSTINNCRLIITNPEEYVIQLIDFAELILDITFEKENQEIIFEVSGSLGAPKVKGFDDLWN